MPPLNPPVAPGGIISHTLRVAPLSGETVGIFDTIDVAAAFDVTGRFDIIRIVGVVRDRRNYKNKYLYGIDPYR